MSDETETVTMTRADFEKAIDESFLNGTKAALETLSGVVRDFIAKVDAAVPGDHSPHDAEMAAARDADRVARRVEGGGL